MEMDVDETSQPEEKAKQVTVILVGAPGSGKSTFCEHVMRSSSRPWARICQDTINNGKTGTKPQCLKSAANALKEGKSVFIDRCNMDTEQRAEFVKLGASHGEVHAVVLDLPAKLCISRSVKRTGHEGNLQGGRAAAVVNRMLQKKELPKLDEGFSRIVNCMSERDVQDAIVAYGALGPSDTLPGGCFGQKNRDAKIQLGIMKFLKKVDVPSSVESSSDNVQKENDNSDGKKDDFHLKPCPDANQDLAEIHHLSEGTQNSDFSTDNIPTLAFPSISTADFQFNIDKASDIIVETVEEFVDKLENARLVLVDLSHGSKILSSVRDKAAKKNIDSRKFFTFVGDITKLYSKGGLSSTAIANAANWRLKPGGGGVNAAIFSAAGPSLELSTKERAKSLQPGNAVVVPLSSDSPLHKSEGVSHVIHVLGPNMNPQRPNCLDNDYTKGCKILRAAYTSLFNGFMSIIKSQAKGPRTCSEEHTKKTSGSKDSSSSGPRSYFGSGDQKSKRDDNYASISKKSKGSEDSVGAKLANLCSTQEERGKNTNRTDLSASRKWDSWAQALYNIAMYPEKHKDKLLEVLDDIVVLNDLYPKAQRHLLVLARCEGLDRLADVHKEHLPLLKKMHSVGLKLAEKYLNENPSMIFRLGYHMVPSMRQLHLHVISQDFNSNHLKNKKHWNSFTTPFFRDSVDVIEEVKNQGKAVINDDEGILSKELRCHRCRSVHPNIPKLKSHISACQAPFPAFLQENCRLVSTQNIHSESQRT